MSSEIFTEGRKEAEVKFIDLTFDAKFGEVLKCVQLLYCNSDNCSF